MTRFKIWAARPRNALLAAVLVTSGYFVVFAWPALTSASAFGGGEVGLAVDSFLRQLPLEIALAASLLLIVAALGWWRECRLTTRPDRPVRVLILPFLIVSLILALAILGRAGGSGDPASLPPDVVAKILIFTMLVGLFEELLFRGVLFHGLRAVSGPVLALVLSSLIFGAMHYVNWIGGQPFGPTSVQVLHAAGGGFLYGAIMLRTGSIWPGVFLHGAWDFSVGLLGTAVHATRPDTVSVDAVASAQADATEGILTFALFGVEPLLGLAILLLWLRGHNRRRHRLPD